MDVIEAHARRLPELDERWVPARFEREELRDALLEGGAAGIATHPLDNVRRNISLLLDGDPDKLFGLATPEGFSEEDVLGLVEAEAGAPIDRHKSTGEVWIDPDHVLDACEALGDRLSAAAGRGAAMLAASGHPTGLDLLYRELVRLAAARGARIVTPADGITWEGPRGVVRHVRYFDGVAMLTDDVAPKHSHAPDAMTRILAEGTPDLVLADHGFAGAAIAHGVETLSVADVNDPALIVAKARGLTDVVVVMDDFVAANDYWPCFQAAAGRFGA